MRRLIPRVRDVWVIRSTNASAAGAWGVRGIGSLAERNSVFSVAPHKNKAALRIPQHRLHTPRRFTSTSSDAPAPPPPSPPTPAESISDTKNAALKSLEALLNQSEFGISDGVPQLDDQQLEELVRLWDVLLLVDKEKGGGVKENGCADTENESGVERVGKVQESSENAESAETKEPEFVEEPELAEELKEDQESPRPTIFSKRAPKQPLIATSLVLQSAWVIASVFRKQATRLRVTQAREGMSDTVTEGVTAPTPSLYADLEKIARYCFIRSFTLLLSDDPPDLGAHLWAKLSSESGTPSLAKPKNPVSIFSTQTKRSAMQIANEIQKAYHQYLVYLLTLAKSANPGSPSETHRLVMDSIVRTTEILATPSCKGSRSGLRKYRRPYGQSSAASSLRGPPSNPVLDLVALWIRLSSEAQSDETVSLSLPASFLDLDGVRYATVSGIHGGLSTSSFATGEPKPTSADAAESQPETDHRKRLARQTFLQSHDTIRKELARLMSPGDADVLTEMWDGFTAVVDAGGDAAPGADDSLASASSHHTLSMSPSQVEACIVSFAEKILDCIRTTNNTRSSEPPSPVLTELSRCLNESVSRLPTPPPLALYHVLLQHHIRSDSAASPNSRTGSLASMKATWERMGADGVKKDLNSYSIYSAGLGRKSDYEGLRQSWEELLVDEECKATWRSEEKARLIADGKHSSKQALLYPPIFIYNTYISRLLNLPRAAGVPMAFRLFEEVCSPTTPYRPDVYTLNTMLRHFASNKDIPGMLQLFQRIPAISKGGSLKPDVVTFTTVVNGLSNAGKHEQAKAVMELMKKEGIEDNLYTYSLRISKLASVGDKPSLASAEQILEEMKSKRILPNAITWVPLINGYIKSGLLKEASSAMSRMRLAGVKMDRVAYNMFIRECVFAPDRSKLDELLRVFRVKAKSSTGRPNIFLAILDKMRTDGASPNEDTWFIILDGCVRMEMWEDAEEVMGEMRGRGFVPVKGGALDRVIQKIRRSR